MHIALLKEKKTLCLCMQIRKLASWKESNYYDLLGVNKKATAKEIKVAYYKKCKTLHPDNNKGDPRSHQKFIALNKAYSVLSEHNSRRMYDENLEHNSFSSNSFSSSQQYQPRNNPQNQWRDAEFDKFIRYSFERNSYWQNNTNNTNASNYMDYKGPLRFMLVLILFLGGSEIFMIKQIYNYDMNQNNFYVPTNKSLLEGINKDINNADEAKIDEKIRVFQELDKIPIKFEDRK